MGVQCVVHWLHHREQSDAMDVILLLVWVTFFPLYFRHKLKKSVFLHLVDTECPHFQWLL